MSSIMTMPYLWFLTECTSFSFSIKYQVFRFSSSLVLGIRDSLETRLLGFVNAFRLVKVKRRICKVSVESSFPYLLYLNGLCVAIRPPPSGKNRENLWGEVTAVHRLFITWIFIHQKWSFSIFHLKQILLKLYFRANFITYQSFLNKNICIHNVSKYSFE